MRLIMSCTIGCAWVELGVITLLISVVTSSDVTGGDVYQPPSWLPLNSGNQSIEGATGFLHDCGICDPDQCPIVSAQSCPGHVVTDECECCNVCIYATELEPVTSVPVPVVGQDGCDQVTCARNEMCVLNIQGIPICRCPSQFWCRRSAKQEICGLNGKTYRSRCYHKHEECTTNKKIRIAHKGACVGNADEALGGSPPERVPGRRRPADRKLRKETEREERREQRRNERLAVDGSTEGDSKVNNHRRGKHRGSKNKVPTILTNQGKVNSAWGLTRKEQRQEQRKRIDTERNRGRQSGDARGDRGEEANRGQRTQRRRKNRRHRTESERHSSRVRGSGNRRREQGSTGK